MICLKHALIFLAFQPLIGLGVYVDVPVGWCWYVMPTQVGDSSPTSWCRMEPWNSRTAVAKWMARIPSSWRWPGPASVTGNSPSYQGLISTKCMCRCHWNFLISSTFGAVWDLILRSLICPEFGILGSGFFRSKACILATAPVKASWKYNVCGSRNHLGNI